jgi:hypothetical protein
MTEPDDDFVAMFRDPEIGAVKRKVATLIEETRPVVDDLREQQSHLDDLLTMLDGIRE